MKKIIQIIPAVTDLYAVWTEGSDNGKQYGVDRAYYLGLDDNGEVYPLVIDGEGLINTYNYEDNMVFDWNGYQWWKQHDADLPVNEYFNRFEEEQRQKNKNIANEILGWQKNSSSEGKENV